MTSKSKYLKTKNKRDSNKSRRHKRYLGGDNKMNGIPQEVSPPIGSKEVDLNSPINVTRKLSSRPKPRFPPGSKKPAKPNGTPMGTSMNSVHSTTMGTSINNITNTSTVSDGQHMGTSPFVSMNEIAGTTMRIVVRTVDGNTTIPLDVEPLDTVETVKNKIQKLQIIKSPISKQNIVFAGNQLDDDKTIMDYKINNNDILFIVILQKEKQSSQTITGPIDV